MATHAKTLVLMLSIALLSGSCVLILPVSNAPAGLAGNGASGDVALSADGRWMVFSSQADDLVNGDTNGASDIFLRDNQTGTTTKVSRDWRGGQANGPSRAPDITADGRYVVYESDATDITDTDTNGATDVFRFDTVTGTTVVVSAKLVGLVLVYGNGASTDPSVSDDGERIAFTSAASNLGVGDANGVTDIFLRDLDANTLNRVSLSLTNGDPNSLSNGPAISADGTVIAYSTFASNILPGDTNGRPDVIAWNVAAGTDILVSVRNGGGGATGFSSQPSISADGSVVSFSSTAGDIVAGDANGTWDVFRRDLGAGVTTRISEAPDGSDGDAGSQWSSISADGSRIAFDSFATNLVAGDTNGLGDIFVWGGAAIERASENVFGGSGDGRSYESALSDDGSVVGFTTDATDLWAPTGDGNTFADVVARPAVTPRVTGAMPDTVVRGQAMAITIQGQNFSPTTTALGLGNLVSATSVTYVSPTELDVVIDVGAASTATNATVWAYDTYPQLGWNTVGAGENAVVPIAEIEPISNRSGESWSVDPETTGFDVSGDGTVVAFEVGFSNHPDDNNTGEAIFRRDLGSGALTVVSPASALGSAPAYDPHISGDGDLIAWETRYTIFTGVDHQVRAHDVATSSNLRIDDADSCETNAYGGVMSRDATAVFYHSNDQCGGGSIVVEYDTAAESRMVVLTGGTNRVQAASGDGRYVAAVNDGVNDYAVRIDTVTGTSLIVQRDQAGSTVSGAVADMAISDDGNLVVFSTTASLTVADANATYDVYVHDVAAGTTRLLSRTAAGGSGNGPSERVDITGDGTTVYFTTEATNLAGGGELYRVTPSGDPELLLAGDARDVAVGTAPGCVVFSSTSDFGPDVGVRLFRWDDGSCG